MLLKNGFLINPQTATQEKLDIRISDGVIRTLGTELTPEEGEQVLDLSGLTVSPGLIDTHIHFRDPGFTYKEDIHTGSLAAANGGFISVVCMANTIPSVDFVEPLKVILSRASQQMIHVY